jgi:hypothetical protein
MKQSYISLPDMPRFFLEESWVLDVRAEPARVTFFLDVVVTSEHPGYRGPKPAEIFDYRRAALVFSAVREMKWAEQRGQRFVDATGEVDFGHIDSFSWERDEFVLDGAWGHMTIVSEIPRITLDEE